MANNSQVSVSLKFIADAAQAKQQIQDLQSQLSKIASIDMSKKLDWSGDIEKGVAAATRLKTILEQSTNVSTGQLDLGKFNQSLKNSGTSLKSLYSDLSGIGVEGAKAFATLTQSITNAEIPLKRSNKLLDDFVITLKNTAKWQISSNIMHGFEGALKSAYGYAQDLNKSLNDIRIVTGQNIDQMSRFAEQANKSAKALSTTTTDYTNASLIYYQQGLSDSEVQQRTDITIKMANAAGQSAEIVSDQMTAVWNNFDNGSKSLEYYADVMTALGAATASSTDEIATGIEKFAAISETVGLSYEYATAALATVTDKTRQSAEVVGTAFKTMFARIEGLELGETLEDGTTLNDYSEALAKVGVNIKDANGELKDMDNILNEMAAVWKTLNRDEQVALAQKVAGVRQYNQLMSLMENWDAMEINLGIASNAQGALQEQADIYAESWEAAQDRVTAALESIYGKLLNDEFFIDMLNGIENVISGIDFLIDSLGGVGGVITSIGAIATKVLHKQLSQGLRDFAYGLKMSTDAGKKELIDLKVEANERMIKEVEGYGTESGGSVSRSYKLQGEEQINYINNVGKMNDLEQSLIEQMMKTNSILRDRNRTAADNVEKARQEAEAYETQINIQLKKRGNSKNGEQSLDRLKSEMRVSSQGSNIAALISSIPVDSEKGVEKLKTSITKLIDEYHELGLELDGNLEEKMKTLFDNINVDNAEEQINSFKNSLDLLNEEFDSYREDLKITLALQEMYADSTLTEEQAFERAENKLRILEQRYKTVAQSEFEAIKASQQMNDAHKQTIDAINRAKGATIDWADGVLYASDTIMSTISICQMFGGVLDTLKDPDMSGWEKFTSILSTTAMTMMTIIPMMKNVKKLYNLLTSATTGETVAKTINAAATWLQVKAENALSDSKEESIKVTNKNKNKTNEDTAKKTVSSMKNKFNGVKTKFNEVLDTKTLQSAGKAVLNLGKTLAPTLIAVTATTAAVVGLVQVYHSANTALAESKEQAEQTSKAYDEIKNSYSDLMSTMENYTSATDSLKDMTAGTAEFREQTAKANEEALKLIQTYDSLAGKYHTENGLIVIDPEALEQVKQDQAEILENAQRASAIANQNVQDKQKDVDITKFRRDTRTTNDKADLAANATTGAAIGTALGAAIGTAILPAIGTVTGTAIGAVLGTVVGGVGGFVATDEVDEVKTEKALEKLEEAYSQEGNAIFADLEQTLKDLGITDKDLIKQLTENQGATKELIVAMNANTLANNALNESIIQQEFGDQIKNKDLSDYGQNQVTKMMGTNLETLTEKLYKSTYKDAVGNMTDAEVQKKYAEAMGWDSENIDNNKGNTGTYYDKEGNVVAEKLNDDVARKFLAQQAAIEQLSGAVDSYVETLRSVVETGNKLGQGVGDSLASFAGGQGGSLGYLNKETLDNFKVSDLDVTKEQAEQMGYESIKDFKKAIKEAKNEAEKAWKDISDTFTDLTLEEAKVLQEASNKTETGAEDIRKYYNALNSEDKELFLKLDFDRLTTEQEWNNEIEYLKNKAALEKVQVKLETVQSAQGSMVEDMTTDDYSAIENSGINWGDAQEGIMEFSEFVKMTYTEQQDYLQSLENIYRDNTIDAAEQMKQAAIDRLETEKQKLEELRQAKASDEDIVAQEDIVNGVQSDINNAESTVAVAQRQEMIDLDLDVEEVEEYAAHLQDVSENSELLDDSLKDNIKTARDVATAVTRMNRGIDKLADGFEDWNEVLTESDETSQEYCEAMNDMKDAMSDVLGTSKEFISNDFIIENLEDIEKAATGDEEAIGRLQQALSKDIVCQVMGVSDFSDLDADMQDLATRVASLSAEDIKVGATLDQGAFIEEANKLIANAGMTVDEAQAYFNSLGYEPEFVTEEKTVKRSIPQETTHTDYAIVPGTIDILGATLPIPTIDRITTTRITGYEEMDETIQVPALSADGTPQIKSLTRTSSGSMNNYSSSNPGGKSPGSGGGGKGSGKTSPAEKVKKTKKSDVVDRYKEVTDALDKNTRALDKANKKADQLYGPGRIKQLQKANKLIKEQNTLLKQQQTEAKKNLTNDKNDLNAAAKAAGLNFSYDSSGNITNYTTEMEKLFNELAQAENTMNSFSTKDQQDKFKESTLQPIQDKIDTLKEALAQYEETRELIQDLQEQYEDNLVQLFNNDLEIVTIAVELNLDAAEAGLEWIEYQLKKIEDQAYSTAEAIALLTDQIPELEDRQEINEWRKEKTLATLVEHGYFSEKDIENFNKGNMDAIDWSKIPESAMNELLTYREELYSINEAYIELRDTINGSVIEAFEEWSEEMHDQMELFDYYDSVITSYQNIADLGGKRLGITDEDLIAYEQERVNNANNRLAGSKSYYDQTKVHRDDIASQLAAAEKRYKDYEAAGDTAGMEAEAINIKAWKETLKTAEEELRDAETTYLEDWQSALEASRDAFLKETEIELKALEEQMAGTYGTIEEMQKEFDRKSEINERYLQDYERIYELSKLNRDLTKKMDETSNVKAKQELAKLQEEILEYQEEGRKISQYDLEYLQKRYDLKLAEIAMEEAQNAKTQVRLTRDSEGNYSYTYTADEDFMADSQQSYEDKLYAITDLSNKHIEEQTALLLQTQQEYLDELALIHEKAANGQYETTEEYQKALDDCTAYYTEKMRYHGGEIDKATNRNAVIYKDDYETYERYTGKKLTEAQKLQAQMDADILAAKAKVEELQIEKQAALDEVHRLHAEGYYASEEEYQDALARAEEQYSGRIDRATEKVNTSVINREKLYGKDAKAYSLESAKKEAAEAGVIQGVEKLLPRWDKAQGSMTNYVKDMTDKIGNAEKGTGYLGQAVKSYGALETNIDTTMKNAGSSIKGFKDDIKKKLITDTDSVKKQSEKTAESIKTVGDASKGLSKTIKDVTSWQKDYSKQIQLAINKNEAFIKSINDAQKAAAKQAKKAAEEKKEPDKPTTPSPSSGGNKNGGDGVAKVGDEVTYVSGLYYYDSLGTAPAGNRGQGKKATITQIKSGAPYPIHLYSTDSAYGWVKKSQISGYDTGGYTGNWGSEGKLAMLHEKELVLNKQDTENMLKIISMVRDLSNVLDMQAYQASLAQLQASHLYHVNSSGETFEQTVTIHAEFPEAIYANEIEAALNNLVNSASQFANRKY